jgi:hypothetical protein
MAQKYQIVLAPANVLEFDADKLEVDSEGNLRVWVYNRELSMDELVMVANKGFWICWMKPSEKRIIQARPAPNVPVHPPSIVGR